MLLGQTTVAVNHHTKMALSYSVQSIMQTVKITTLQKNKSRNLQFSKNFEKN